MCWVTAVMCLFAAAWLFMACSPILDSENVFAHSLHLVFVVFRH